MNIYVLLYNSGTDKEGIHSIELKGRTIVLMFEDRDDATRYCGLLEAQDFPLPTVEMINIEEIKDFCIKLDYEYKLVQKNFVPKTAEDRLVISPPQKNLEVENWAKDKNNKNILSMTLEHYPVMTENEILKITEKALKKWDINYISIIHRIGKLLPKDKIVYVGVSSKHRQNAFNACNFIMDYLKTNATFWKIEEFENENKWVIQDKKEIEALEKWS